MDKFYIWRLIFQVAVLLLVGVISKPTFKIEQTSWPKNEPFWNSPQDVQEYNLITRNEDGVEATDPHYDKRGFSMLSRWRPFNLISKHRTAIRNLNRPQFPQSEYDIVSAETRALARPSGQPLRWG